MPATGRTGGAVTTRGTAAAAHSPSLPPAGYAASDLDGTIRSYVAAVEKSIRTTESLSAKVAEAVTTLMQQVSGTPEEQAELLTRLHERLTKANLNLVKSTDELTRLRSFVAGGPDERKDLTVNGELELRAMLLTAVTQLGWRVTDADGRAIEVAA